jgi:hypothetical protein
MQIFGLALSIIAIFLMLLGFFPRFGAINWIAIPFAGISLVICGMAVAFEKKEEPKSSGIVGMVLCCCVIIFGGLRLILGAGIL